ncbi:hypothetical protein REH59_04250 [Pseudomonas sp. BO3-4]|uniref:hypothetical protein n=1 Tax=Pseudomonas sp. BO3-4 TaxID=3094916 RepID=UPI002A59B56E|nr:hypothetical protein [Pseudomonas sp. BO3-4]WPO30867.1 hypothetical protein REH59_04250 [Pseudomonas sp. BO3-4]
MNVKNFGKLITVALLLVPAFALGASVEDATSNRVELIAEFNKLIIITGFLIGLAVTIAGGYKLIQIGNQGSKFGWGAPAIYILAGVVMMNVSPSLSVITNTYFKVDFCTMIDESQSVSSSCFKDEISGLTGPLKERITRLSSDSTAQAFMQNIEIIIGIFQVIGFIYFLTGAYGLTQVANGSAQHGYGKPIITMTASALIVDIPHTATMFIDTLHQIGINF